MATVLASNIIGRARTIFQDDTAVRWPDAECLGWLNDGQREIVILRPEANVVNATMALVAGTKQTIPAIGVQLIDVVRNMTGVGNATAGGVVRLVDREVLDSTIPTWHSDPAAANGEVQHYIFDGRDPKTFYVYPQASGTNGVEIIYSASPTDVVGAGVGGVLNGTEVITLDGIYANALLDYILYRVYSKDADYSGNASRAVSHYTAFNASLGLKIKSDTMINPNNNAGPSKRTVPDAR